MAQKFQGKFRQEGTIVDHTPSSALLPGDVVVQNALVGVTPHAIAANALGAMQVQGTVDLVKITGAISAGVAVYWKAAGDPVGGVTGTGAVTSTSSGNTFVGFVVSAALSGDEFATVYMVPAISVTSAQVMTAVIADPGDAGAIPATDSGSCPLVSGGGGETRTLADPATAGIMLNLMFKTDGSDCVVTTASPVNQTGNNTLTFADVGDAIQLIACDDGADIEWRILANDGIALTTV